MNQNHTASTGCPTTQTGCTASAPTTACGTEPKAAACCSESAPAQPKTEACGTTSTCTGTPAPAGTCGTTPKAATCDSTATAKSSGCCTGH